MYNYIGYTQLGNSVVTKHNHVSMMTSIV